MNIHWFSNFGLHTSDGQEAGVTGYSNQTALFVPRLRGLGHKLSTGNFYGTEGSPLKIDDIWHYPRGRDPYGNDILAADALHLKADIVITLMDIWILNAKVTNKFRFVPYFPIDHDPLPPAIDRILKTAYQPIVYSRFGERIAQEAGYSPMYVPHAVDTKKLYPEDRAAARKVLGCPEDRFLIGMVAANKGFPARKCFDLHIRAFARLYEKHKDAMLYLHTDVRGQAGGDNIDALVKLAGLPPSALATVDQYLYNRGLLNSAYMRTAYNAMDVLVNASRGEGFGIPILEAQACGVPVIVTDFSSMPELCFGGWKVPFVDKDFSQDSYQVIPSVDGIYEAMEAAYQLGEQGCADLGTQAYEKAIEYDADKVTQEYWKPALEAIEARVNEDTSKWQMSISKAQDTCKGGHAWAQIGLWEDGEMIVPCKRPHCPAKRRIVNGIAYDEPTGFEMEINGEHLDIEDNPDGGVAKIVWKEITNTYHLDEFNIEPGDIVLDIGAQVGVVSIYLAKRQPNAVIYAFEPFPENYARLIRNLEANHITNVIPINKGLSGDGRGLALWGDTSQNSGGASAFTQGGDSQTAIIVPTTTLADVLDALGDQRVGLLKIDCEGAEYEVLTASPELLRRVDWLVGEFHINTTLSEKGYSPDLLKRLCEQYIGGGHVITTHCRIAE